MIYYGLVYDFGEQYVDTTSIPLTQSFLTSERKPNPMRGSRSQWGRLIDHPCVSLMCDRLHIYPLHGFPYFPWYRRDQRPTASLKNPGKQICQSFETAMGGVVL